MTKKSFEIEYALKIIDLLKQYESTKSIFKIIKRKQIKYQIKNINKDIYLSMDKFSPDELITRITKAVSLNRHRPKNMPIVSLALSDDLYDVHGDFSTFDLELSKMDRTQENPDKMREHFKQGIKNLDIMTKQFTYDWIQRLNKHKDLVQAARTAKGKKEIEAYNNLFQALVEDFVKEYNDVHIDVKMTKNYKSCVKELKSMNIKITSSEQCNGTHLHRYNFFKPLTASQEKKLKAIKNFEKRPDLLPKFTRESIIRIIFDNIKTTVQPEYLFYKIISIFVHEMHHALDLQRPNDGALGPQIYQADNEIYTSYNTDVQKYLSSATEISSYAIENELYKQLKSIQY